MESSAAGAGASAASATDDPYFPIYISSSEEDEQVYFASSSYSLEQIQMQEAIILSLDYSHALVTGPSSASATPSSSLPSGAATAQEPPPDRKSKRKLSSEDGPGDFKKKKRSKRSRFSCAICLERVQDSEKFLVSQYAHAFCKSCVGRYVAAKIAENVALIGCPDPGCFLEMHLCQDIVPPELFDRWNIALCEDVVGDKKFYCPFKDCSALLIHDDAMKIREMECPHCYRLFCTRCHVPWHDGIKCKEFRKLGDDEGKMI